MNTSFERKAQKEEWLTPRWLVERLGPFDLDPCAPICRPWPTACNHLTIQDNGLLKPWFGFVWCNPPYGRKTEKFLRRMVEHGDGIALLFARTDTKCWHEWIFPKATSAVFIQKRLMFCDVKGNPGVNGAGSPSALIAYGRRADARLYAAVKHGAIKGAYVRLALTEEHQP